MLQAIQDIPTERECMNAPVPDNLCGKQYWTYLMKKNLLPDQYPKIPLEVTQQSPSGRILCLLTVLEYQCADRQATSCKITAKHDRSETAKPGALWGIVLSVAHCPKQRKSSETGSEPDTPHSQDMIEAGRTLRGSYGKPR